MNFDDETPWEARIDRELKSLGDLPAPATLVSRVLRAVEQRAALPWYRRSWQTWPAGWQRISLAALLAMFGGLCWGALGLTQCITAAADAEVAGGRFAVWGVLWRTLGVFAGAGRLVIHQLGTGFILGCAAALLMAYAACVGLGTVYVRLALARR